MPRTLLCAIERSRDLSTEIDETSIVWELDLDWPVLTADGVQLGVVEGVHRYHIIVSATYPSPTMLFVPVDAIADIENDRVYLSVELADIARMDWSLIPDDTVV